MKCTPACLKQHHPTQYPRVNAKETRKPPCVHACISYQYHATDRGIPLSHYHLRSATFGRSTWYSHNIQQKSQIQRESSPDFHQFRHKSGRNRIPAKKTPSHAVVNPDETSLQREMQYIVTAGKDTDHAKSGTQLGTKIVRAIQAEPSHVHRV